MNHTKENCTAHDQIIADCGLGCANCLACKCGERHDFVLARDGEKIFSGTEKACYMRLQKIQSQSADWAMEHEGYTISI